MTLDGYPNGLPGHFAAGLFDSIAQHAAYRLAKDTGEYASVQIEQTDLNTVEVRCEVADAVTVVLFEGEPESYKPLRITYEKIVDRYFAQVQK